MITLREIRQNLFIFLKSYKIIVILLLIISISLVGFFYVKKTNLFIENNSNTNDRTVNNNKTEDAGYDYKLFLKVDSVSSKGGGIMQSIWARFPNGKEVKLYNDEIKRHDIKAVGDFFTDFEDKISDSNRYGFFYVESFSNYEYKPHIFDKETKEIKPVSEAETKIDNAYIFSPDYKHFAILHTVSKDNLYRFDHTKYKFYVDLIDTATLDVVSRYYLPENYTLFAMNYTDGYGRASWDNIWISNSEFQVAQFKDTNKQSLWRDNFEKHIISIKSAEQAKQFLQTSADVKYGFEWSDNLYVLVDDGSYSLIKYSLGKDINRGDLHYSVFFTNTTSKYITACDADGPAGELFVRTRINKDDFTSIGPVSSSDSEGCY